MSRLHLSAQQREMLRVVTEAYAAGREPTIGEIAAVAPDLALRDMEAAFLEAVRLLRKPPLELVAR